MLSGSFPTPKLKLELWDGYATGFLGVLSLDGIEVVSEVWEGPFPGRERTVGPESKDSIFNRIAASEGSYVLSGAHFSDLGQGLFSPVDPLRLTLKNRGLATASSL